MKLPWYLSVAFALVSAALGAWVSVRGAELDAKTATIKARDATIATLTQSVAQAKKTNTENLNTIALLKEDLRYQGRVALKFETQARERERALQSVLKGIADAPATDDGPVAPVLARELGRLRNVFDQARAADGADRGPPRATGSPGQ